MKIAVRDALEQLLEAGRDELSVKSAVAVRHWIDGAPIGENDFDCLMYELDYCDSIPSPTDAEALEYIAGCLTNERPIDLDEIVDGEDS